MKKNIIYILVLIIFISSCKHEIVADDIYAYWQLQNKVEFDDVTFEKLELMATVYALGRVNMVLTNRSRGIVKIVNGKATDYDWNVGGGTKRDAFIRANNLMFGINPNKHGFKTYYYGVGTLRK